MEEDYGDEWDESDEDDEDDESPWEHMARVAADIEAGRAEVPPRWKLDRPSPGVLVWTTPSGRRYGSTLAGDGSRSPEQVPGLASPPDRNATCSHMTDGGPGRAMAGGRMPATLQPVIVTPLPLLLAFYKALLGAAETSRMPKEGRGFTWAWDRQRRTRGGG